MSLSIDYKVEGGIGVFHIQGKEGHDDLFHAWSLILRAIREDDLKSVLLLDSAGKSASTDDLMDLEEWLQKVNFPRHIKVAMVVLNPAAKNFDEVKASIASLKGWEIRDFDDEARAREWLG